MSRANKNLMFLIAIIAIILITIGTTFSIFKYSRTSSNGTSVKAGNIEFAMIDGENVTLENAFPQSDENGNKNRPYRFTVKNNSTNGVTIKYDVSFVNNNGDLINGFTNNQIKFSLKKNGNYIAGTDSKTGRLVSSVITTGTDGIVLPEQQIAAKSIDSYELRIWIDGKVTYGTENEIDENGLLVGKFNDFEYSLKVKVGASNI